MQNTNIISIFTLNFYFYFKRVKLFEHKTFFFFEFDYKNRKRTIMQEYIHKLVAQTIAHKQSIKQSIQMRSIALVPLDHLVHHFQKI